MKFLCGVAIGPTFIIDKSDTDEGKIIAAILGTKLEVEIRSELSIEQAQNQCTKN